MNWQPYIKAFGSHLKLEAGLSTNTVEAYLNDVRKLEQYIALSGKGIAPADVTLSNLQGFLAYLAGLGVGATSQARIISGIRAFYRCLLFVDVVDANPADLLEMPAQARKIPDVLTVTEINSMLNATDESKLGLRNRAILEVMYSAGLRVSETIGLHLDSINSGQGTVRVFGKRNAERIVPIGRSAIEQVAVYCDRARAGFPSIKSSDHLLFLNRNGQGLTRVMVFLIIKKLATLAKIKKKISPHTFRHSFATHMVEAGANLRAVQDMLGHASITTTEIYTHLDVEFLRENIRKYHPRS
jgi:integrase/recombinase XerD